LKKVTMSQRATRTEKHRKRNRRWMTLAWVVGVSALIIILLYRGRADWLYVMATLGLSALLVLVAFADLGGGRKGVDEAALGDDSASIGSGITATAASSTATAAAAAPSDWRGTKTRKKK
jgi:hypothetical protein